MLVLLHAHCLRAGVDRLYERLHSYFKSIYCRETSAASVIDRSKDTVVLKENGDTARLDNERIVYERWQDV